MKRQVCLALLLHSWGLGLFAASRVEIVAMFEGERVAGARACFSRAAVFPEDPRVLDLLVSGPETRCLPADDVLSVPAGRWHYYVVANSRGLVSMHPAVFDRSSGSTDEEPVRQSIVQLTAAATLNVAAAAKKLQPGESLSVYVTHQGSDVSPAALVPIAPGMTDLPVPAEVPLVPLIMRGQEIVHVGEPVTIERGGRAAATFTTLSAATVVIPFRIPDSNKTLSRPVINVIHRRTGQSIARYTATKADYRGLIFVRAVDAGKLNVFIDSDEFSAEVLEVTVPVEAAGKVLLTEDLVISLSRDQAVIEWAIDDTFAADARAQSRCPGVSDGKPPSPALRLYACPAEMQVSRPWQLSACGLLRDTKLPNVTSGVIRWPAPTQVDGLVAELLFGGISSLERIRVSDRRQIAGRIALSPRPVMGRVTYRKEPVVAEVSCGGSFHVVDPSGYYRCWRPANASPRLFVNVCDGSAPYEQAFDDAATVVDIEIAANAIHVKVLDDVTRKPIEGAYVSLWEGSPNEIPEPPSTVLEPTDSAGEVSVSRQEPRQIAICAFKDGYARDCKERVTIERDSDFELTLTLRKETRLTGSIAAPGEIVNGRLYVMAGAAQIAEAEVARDGSFSLLQQPPPGAAFVLVSSSLPLCILRPAPATGDSLRFSVPPLRPHAFSVSSRTSRARLTLELGGVLLSSNAFARHQFLRREQYVVEPGRPISVQNVDSTLGVSVVVGDVAIAGGPTGNPSSFPRHPVGNRTSVDIP